MQMANIVMMTTCLIILLCCCGDCVRLRNSGRKKLKETTHRIHRERSPPQTPEKNRMKKYFADKLNPYLDEVENACVRLCVEKEENDRKGREILEKQQSTDNDSSGDEVEIVAEEALVQNVTNAEKVESAIELNQHKIEDPLPVDSETAATHGGETLLHEEHEDGEISQTSTDIHEVDHKEPDHGMEHNKGKCLAELSVNVSEATLSRIMKSFSRTLKRIHVLPARRNDADTIEERWRYTRTFLKLFTEVSETQIYFLDEVGFCLAMHTKRGRSLRGKRTVQVAPGLRTRNF
uniref:Uncharacterized protein n=1 Tax=Plectus sambesii TaxID=2011161 RepID=A0A914VX18_9BILA